MSLTRILRFCAIVILAAFTATPAWCTLISTYTDASSWVSNATGALTTTPITFGDLANAGSTASIAGGSLTRSGVQFVGMFNSTPALYVYSNTYANPNFDFGLDGGTKTGYLGTNSGVPMWIDVYLPTGTTAWGADLMSYGPGYNVAINVDGTAYSSPLTQAHPTRVFYGQTYTAPVTHITFQVPVYTTLLLDNFRVGTAATQQQQQQPPPDAPEAVTMIMIGSGLMCIQLMRRRMI